MTPTFIELIATPDLSGQGLAAAGTMASGNTAVGGTMPEGQGDVPKDFMSQLSLLMAGAATKAEENSGATENQEEPASDTVLSGTFPEEAAEVLTEALEEETLVDEDFAQAQGTEGMDVPIEEEHIDTDDAGAKMDLFLYGNAPMGPAEKAFSQQSQGDLSTNGVDPADGTGDDIVSENGGKSGPFQISASGQGAGKESTAAETNTEFSATPGGKADADSAAEEGTESPKNTSASARLAQGAEATADKSNEMAKTEAAGVETVQPKDPSLGQKARTRSQEKEDPGETSIFGEDQNSVMGEEDASGLAMDSVEEETGIKPEIAFRRTPAGQTEGGTSPLEATSKDGADPAGGTGHAQPAEKSAPETAATRIATTPRSMQSSVVNQLADRAVFLQRNGQSEVRMDLKPEYLGRIQMKVSSENHRITVHMMAETHMAREIIEANLGQLRADLANQGVNVDQIEVAMFTSGDPNSQGASTPDQGKNGRFSGSLAKAQTVDPSASDATSDVSRETHAGDRSVDYFA